MRIAERSHSLVSIGRAYLEIPWALSSGHDAEVYPVLVEQDPVVSRVL